MKLRGSWSALVFVAAVLVASSVNADGTKSQRCWNCIPEDLTFDACKAAPNNGYGEGIDCTETVVTFLGIPVGQRCRASGGACYYIDTTGGGGGGGGGSEGGCELINGSCPIECFDCGGLFY